MSIFKANFFLLSASFFWGITFIVQKTTMDSMGPFTFTGIRFFFGTSALGALYLLQRKPNIRSQPSSRRIVLQSSLVLGLLLFLGTIFQQYSLIFTSPTHASLLTATYVLFVPLVLLFRGKAVPGYVWWNGLIIFLGIYLLTINPFKETVVRFEWNQILLGDFLSLIGALFWALHIIVLGWYLKQGCRPLQLILGQSFFVSLVSLFLAVVMEEPRLDLLLQHKFDFLVGGILSIALGYYFQAIGQKYTTSAIAAILLSAESLFASLADYFLLDRILSHSAYLGGGFILLGIVLIQICREAGKKNG